MNILKCIEVGNLIDQESESFQEKVDTYILIHIKKIVSCFLFLIALLSIPLILNVINLMFDINSIEADFVAHGLGELKGLFNDGIPNFNIGEKESGLFYEFNSILSVFAERVSNLSYGLIALFAMLMVAIKSRMKSLSKMENCNLLLLDLSFLRGFGGLFLSTLLLNKISLFFSRESAFEKLKELGVPLEHLEMAKNLYLGNEFFLGASVLVAVAFVFFGSSLAYIYETIKETKAINNDLKFDLEIDVLKQESNNISKLKLAYKKEISKMLKSKEEIDIAIDYFAAREDSNAELSSVETGVRSELKKKLKEMNRLKNANQGYFQKERSKIKKDNYNIINN